MKWWGVSTLSKPCWHSTDFIFFSGVVASRKAWKEGLSRHWWICICFHGNILVSLGKSPSLLKPHRLYLPEMWFAQNIAQDQNSQLCFVGLVAAWSHWDSIASVFNLSSEVLSYAEDFSVNPFCSIPCTNQFASFPYFCVLLLSNFVSLLDSTPSNFWNLPTFMLLWITQTG